MLYDPIYRFCAALTNQHIVLYPLRADAGPRYMLHRKQLYRDGILAIAKKAEIRKHHRQLQALLAATANQNESDEENEVKQETLQEDNLSTIHV